MVEQVLACVVCGAGFRSYRPCGNGCCISCHALYCTLGIHTLELAKARADCHKHEGATRRAAEKPIEPEAA